MELLKIALIAAAVVLFILIISYVKAPPDVKRISSQVFARRKKYL